MWNLYYNDITKEYKAMPLPKQYNFLWLFAIFIPILGIVILIFQILFHLSSNEEKKRKIDLMEIAGWKFIKTLNEYGYSKFTQTGQID